MLLVAGVVEQRSDRGVEGAAASLQVWDMRTRTLRTTIPLAVIPDHVIAVDASHAVVSARQCRARRRLKNSTRAWRCSAVDVNAARADDREVIAPAPLASGRSTGAVVVLSPDATMTIVAVAGDAAPTVIDMRSLLGADEVPTAVAVELRTDAAWRSERRAATSCSPPCHLTTARRH